MATPSTVQRSNPVNKEIAADTKGLSQRTRYVNGAIVAFLFSLYVGEHHIPPMSITPAEWHWFLRISFGAIFALLLDGAQALNNLLAHKRKLDDLEKARAREIIFGKKELRFKLSWWLFYAKLAITCLNIAACVVVLWPIISRWMP